MEPRATARPHRRASRESAEARLPGAVDAREAVAAVLRWRAWWLGHHLPGRWAAAARLLPVLLHASFPQGRLSGEPPGVAGLRYRRRWSSLARDLGLPPPSGMQRGRCLVEAVLGVPTPDGLEALVVVPGDARPEEMGAVQERMEAAQAALAAAGTPVKAGLFPPARLAADPESSARALAFGGLLAGAPGAATWQGLEEPSRRPLEPHLAAALAASAPTPLSTLALTLLSLTAAPSPLPAMLSMILEGESARRLADPDHFAVRWAGRTPALRRALEEARALSRADGPADPADLPRLLGLGRELALACAGAIRRARGPIDRVAKRLWQEALGAGVPRVLLPALGRRLAALERAGGPLLLEPARRGRCYEVALRDGSCLGRGRDPVQARIRALALFASARAAAQGERAVGEATAALDPAWRVVAQRLARLRPRPALLLVVEAGGAARPGPPFDLLNRGPGRVLEFEGALAVSVAPGRRPAGRVLDPAETVETVIRRACGDPPLDVLAARPESRPVAARLAQIAGLLRDPPGDGAVAVEAGGRVLVPFRDGLRRFPLARFASRPRICAPDPESPDLALGAGERASQRRQSAGMVQARVTLAGNGAAAVLYADGQGGHLREVVPLAELEDHLREARALVQEADHPAVLTLRLAGDVEPEIRRAGTRRCAASVRVAGELPRLEVEIAGVRFSGSSALGWEAAAEALLADWPPGEEGRIGVSAVTASARGRPAPPLLALWAASVVRRRLRTRISRALRLIGRPARAEEAGEGER